MKMQNELTAKGLARLEAELKVLITVKKPENEERIRDAISHGDLSENAEYIAAKEEQGKIAGRILELEQIINTATVIDHHKRQSFVALGAKVTFENLESDSGDQGFETFTIVGSLETDPAKGMISNLCPIGAGLLGKKANDVVSVKIPDGVRKIKVIKVT